MRRSRIWNELRECGLSEYAIAGIMGNMACDTDFKISKNELNKLRQILFVGDRTVLDSLNAAQSVREATEAYCSAIVKPADMEHQVAKRTKWGNAIYSEYAQNQSYL